MTIAIYTCGAVYYTDGDDPQDVRSKIAAEETIPCWWVVTGPTATRYDEDCLFFLEKVDLIRTEGDDD